MSNVGYGSVAGLVVGGMLTGGLGAVGTLAWMGAGSLVGHYLGRSNKSKAETPTHAPVGRFSVGVDLYYSKSLLGHFTLIVTDSIDMMAYRIHFVDRDAEQVHGKGRATWAKHKLKQATGFAKGRVLENHESTASGFQRLQGYAAPGRTKIKHWDVSPQDAERMLHWVRNKVAAQGVGSHDNYSYVVYSNGVDNCGSFAIKCLGQAGLSVTLPNWKTFLQLPTLIKDDI